MDDALQIGIRLCQYALLGLLFGLPLFAVYGLDRAARSNLRLPQLVARGAALALLISALGLAVVAAGMAGVPLAAVDRSTVTLVATMPGVGTGWQIRTGALLLLLGGAVFLGRSAHFAPFAALTGGVALASLAATGHAAMAEGPAATVHLLADIAHLLAAGAWIGALAGLSWLLWRPASRLTVATAHRALAGFATAGTLIVGVLVVSGMVNAWQTVGPGQFLALGDTGYGRLLLVKLGLFTLMLGLAAAHRFRLTPALALAVPHLGGALAWLRGGLALEIALGVMVLAAVAWLGTLTPPIAQAG